MNVLINHCWCFDSNWGGNYNCRVIVGLDRIRKGKTYYDKPEEDWTNLTYEHRLESVEKFREPYTIRLKDEVVEWLSENIGDRNCDENPKAWAIGTDVYNSHNPLSYNIFFERTPDALKFIKRWSVYKKPVSYLNYFRDIRRELDFETNKLKRVKR